jgi:urea carboxylase
LSSCPARGEGLRAYLALAGGLAAGEVLGSRATFPLGRFGGHEGRALRRGDRIEAARLATRPPVTIEPGRRPALTRDWTLRVLAGPHGAPDFLRADDLEMIFSQAWEVAPQSDRTGVRLAGPAPRWAREDGGDAGLHPSNLHDNAYVVGSLIFTGDTPVFVGPDGPSLGGFVSPAVVVRADRWKLGQLRAGDRVRLEAVELAERRPTDPGRGLLGPPGRRGQWSSRWRRRTTCSCAAAATARCSSSSARASWTCACACARTRCRPASRTPPCPASAT